MNWVLKMSQKLPGKLRGMYQAEGATYAKTWGGWVTVGRIICHSTLRGTARSESKEGRVPHGRDLLRQF